MSKLLRTITIALAAGFAALAPDAGLAQTKPQVTSADKPEMTAQLAEAYTVAGNANNALVIPAGLAFARAVAKQPELNLYVADKRHPSLAGTYLAACVVFSALTGKSPVGTSHLAGVDAPTAKFLQEIAWATVQEYYGK